MRIIFKGIFCLLSLFYAVWFAIKLATGDYASNVDFWILFLLAIFLFGCAIDEFVYVVRYFKKRKKL
jgi:predicted neutral ceramidase superfamily lipid hydrolase